MLVKAVIWDIGGVIIRTEDPAPRDRLAAELGVTRKELNSLVFGDSEGTRAQLGEISVDELWDYVHAELGLAPDQHPDIRKRFFGGDIVDYGLVDFIRTLKPQYKTAVLSNAWNNLRQVLTDHWGIADAFDTMVISGEEGVKKPDRQIFEIVLNRLGVDAQDAVFIDDFTENIQAAADLGLRTVHFRSSDQAIGDLKLLLGI